MLVSSIKITSPCCVDWDQLRNIQQSHSPIKLKPMEASGWGRSYYCCIYGDMAYSGGVQGGQKAERVDAKTVVMRATNELQRSQRTWIRCGEQLGCFTCGLRMGRESHAWLQPGHLILSRQMGCKTSWPDMLSGCWILGGGYWREGVRPLSSLKF